MSAYCLMIIILLGWLIARYVHRLYFHPLSHIPGPRLAALSYFYQFYFDVIKPGQYMWEIQRLHEIYGPLIRINPREIHVNDPEYYQQIHALCLREKVKDLDFEHVFSLTGSAFSTVGPDLNRRCPGPLDELLSKKAIGAMELLIQKNLDLLVLGIEQRFRANQVIKLDTLFVTYTADIIHHDTYGYSKDHLESYSLDNETTGAEMTGHALTIATFHLYSNPLVLGRLREELREVMPRPNSFASWSQLQRLQYMSAVVHESFRLASRTSGCSSRVVSTEILIYRDMMIPRGTAISSTNHLIPGNSTVSPDSDKFDPEQWFGAANQGKRLDTYLINFSNVSRSSLGRNLIIANMFLVLARLVRRFDFEMANIECDCNPVMPKARHGYLSVGALVTKDLQI